MFDTTIQIISGASFAISAPSFEFSTLATLGISMLPLKDSLHKNLLTGYTQAYYLITTLYGAINAYEASKHCLIHPAENLDIKCQESLTNIKWMLFLFGATYLTEIAANTLHTHIGDLIPYKIDMSLDQLIAEAYDLVDNNHIAEANDIIDQIPVVNFVNPIPFIGQAVNFLL